MRRGYVHRKVFARRPMLERLEDRTLLAPTMLRPNLDVRPVMGGLENPTSLAFLGTNEFLVLEKNTGKVQHVLNGALEGTPLDLAVNVASERGLLGIALDPNFSVNHFVYLFWTCASPAPTDPAFPSEEECADQPQLGADTAAVLNVPLFGNRVDRFIWDTSGVSPTLTWDENLIKLRVFQNDGVSIPPNQGDEGQPPFGNHDGGVITFGPDGKLYVIIGDLGRRSQMQNLPSGPTETGLGDPVPDDQFGGPQPDDEHFAGVILRMNTDGSAPIDNPFFALGGTIGGEVGANIQLLYAYGIRNSFGMAFDPVSDVLWATENGDDSFDEINRVAPGFNSGWIQLMGPLARLAQFKEIETTFGTQDLQQLRWPPERIADTAPEALARLFQLAGSVYSDPEFSWKFAVPPTAMAFLDSKALGPQYRNDLFVGNGAGYLLHFNLTGDREQIAVDDPDLEDRVADNLTKFDLTESESLLFGKDFGIITDVKTGPNGNLYVVSIEDGAVYEIFRTKAVGFAAVAGAPGRVEIMDENRDALGSFNPFPGYSGGVSVALGDVNNDGFDDLVTAATTGNPHTKIYSGAAIADGTFFTNPELHLLAQGFPYGINFNVGTNVAVGDVDGDGFWDLVTGAIPGNPHVKVFDGEALLATGIIPTESGHPSLLAEGFAYRLNFNIGANVAAGDVDGDNRADIVTGASAGNPHTKVFDAEVILATGVIPTNDDAAAVMADFFPYALQFNVGAFVTVGDFDNDGFGDVITGASIGNPHVVVFDGEDIALGDDTPNVLDSFFAFEQNQNIGVSVAAEDFTGDGRADILVGTRAGLPRRRLFASNLPGDATLLETETHASFDGGLWVAA